jgi:hypothetical protein
MAPEGQLYFYFLPSTYETGAVTIQLYDVYLRHTMLHLCPIHARRIIHGQIIE